MPRLLQNRFLPHGLTAALFVVATLATQAAETAPTPNGVRLTKYIIGVADLEKSYAFYRALGIDFEGAGSIRPAAVLPDMVRNLVDVPAGTKFRNVMLKIPGADFPLEATEFTAMDVKPGRPRPYDPGAAVLILTVRDLSAAVAAAKKAGGEVVTTGGAPVKMASGANAVMVKDPDSFYVEFVQSGAPPAATGPNVISARFATVVADAEKAARFYHDSFGLETKLNAWNSSENSLKLAGLSNGQMRSATLTVPGTKLDWSLIEFKTPGTTPYKLRIPDPGAPAVGFEVHDLAAAFTAVKSAGGSVITVGEKPLQGGKGERFAFTRDPNGILVELAQGAGK